MVETSPLAARRGILVAAVLLFGVGCVDESSSIPPPPTESVTTTTSDPSSAPSSPENSTAPDNSTGTAVPTEPNHASGTASPSATRVPENRTATAPPPPPEFGVIAGLIAQGQLGKARQVAGKFLVEHRENGRILFLFGLTYHKEKRYAEAKPYFERALLLEPEYDPIHHFFGYCLYYLGDMTSARRQFEAHLEASPSEADSHFGLGLVELEVGNLDAAETRFRRSIELTEALRATHPQQYRARRSDLAKFRVRMADVQFARGEYESARDELLAALEINPDLYVAHYTLSLVHRRLGDDGLADEALRSFEAVREAVHPDRSERP
jgi:Tfp pilus assembly protein PilF